MKGNMVKQKNFVGRLLSRLHRDPEMNERIGALTEKDINHIINAFWEEIAFCLYRGKRVIFEGVMSFFTNPVKRKCHDMQNGTSWLTYNRRVRIGPKDPWRKQAELEMTQGQYEEMKQTKKEKENSPAH